MIPRETGQEFETRHFQNRTHPMTHFPIYNNKTLSFVPSSVPDQNSSENIVTSTDLRVLPIQDHTLSNYDTIPYAIQ